jgi:hypothetical protein
MLDLWKELPWWLKTLGVLFTLLLGILVMLFVSVRLGAAIVGLSLVMVIFGTKDNSERNGYNF